MIKASPPFALCAPGRFLLWTLATLAASQFGCRSKNLGSEEALALIHKQVDSASPQCTIPLPGKLLLRDKTFDIEYEGWSGDRGADLLTQLHLLAQPSCADAGTYTKCTASLSADADFRCKTQIDSRTQADCVSDFRCGDMIPTISSITTESSRATILFVAKAAPSPQVLTLAKQPSGSSIRIPRATERRGTAKAIRSDDGKWTLEGKIQLEEAQ